MIKEDDGYVWSPEAEAAFKRIMAQHDCKQCGVKDAPVLSLDGYCEECLHKQGRGACCLDGDCGGTP